MTEQGSSSPETTDLHPIRLRYRHVQVYPPGWVAVCRTWPLSLPRPPAVVITAWFREALESGQVKTTRYDMIPSIRGATCCELLGEDDQVVATGYAFCSCRDQFCRRTGRQIAFGRASRPGRHAPSPD